MCVVRKSKRLQSYVSEDVLLPLNNNNDDDDGDDDYEEDSIIDMGSVDLNMRGNFYIPVLTFLTLMIILWVIYIYTYM